MDLKKQVVSLELAKQLKKLGVKQKSIWHWTKDEIEEYDGNEWIAEHHNTWS